MNLQSFMRARNIFSPRGQIGRPTSSFNFWPQQDWDQDINSTMPPNPGDSGDNFADIYRQLTEAEPGPSQKAYRDFLAQGVPSRQDYSPTKMQRLAAILSGIGTSDRYGGGGEMTMAMLEHPYERALADYKTKGGVLSQAAGEEEKNISNKRQILNNILTGNRDMLNDESLRQLRLLQGKNYQSQIESRAGDVTTKGWTPRISPTSGVLEYTRISPETGQVEVKSGPKMGQTPSEVDTRARGMAAYASGLSQNRAMNIFGAQREPRMQDTQANAMFGSGLTEGRAITGAARRAGEPGQQYTAMALGLMQIAQQRPDLADSIDFINHMVKPDANPAKKLEIFNLLKKQGVIIPNLDEPTIEGGESIMPTYHIRSGAGKRYDMPWSKSTPPTADDMKQFIASQPEELGLGEKVYKGVFEPPEFVTKGARDISTSITTPRLNEPQVPLQILPGFSMTPAQSRGFLGGATEGAANLLSPANIALTASGMGALGKAAPLVNRGIGAIQAIRGGQEIYQGKPWQGIGDIAMGGLMNLPGPKRLPKPVVKPLDIIPGATGYVPGGKPPMPANRMLPPADLEQMVRDSPFTGMPKRPTDFIAGEAGTLPANLATKPEVSAQLAGWDTARESTRQPTIHPVMKYLDEQKRLSKAQKQINDQLAALGVNRGAISNEIGDILPSAPARPLRTANAMAPPKPISLSTTDKELQDAIDLVKQKGVLSVEDLKGDSNKIINYAKYLKGELTIENPITSDQWSEEYLVDRIKRAEKELVNSYGPDTAGAKEAVSKLYGRFGLPPSEPIKNITPIPEVNPQFTSRPPTSEGNIRFATKAEADLARPTPEVNPIRAMLDRMKKESGAIGPNKYTKITLQDGRKILIKVTNENDKTLRGIEVGIDGDEIIPKGKNKQGQTFTERQHIISKDTIKSQTPYEMDNKYGELRPSLSERLKGEQGFIGKPKPTAQQVEEQYNAAVAKMKPKSDLYNDYMNVTKGPTGEFEMGGTKFAPDATGSHKAVPEVTPKVTPEVTSRISVPIVSLNASPDEVVKAWAGGRKAANQWGRNAAKDFADLSDPTLIQKYQAGDRTGKLAEVQKHLDSLFQVETKAGVIGEDAYKNNYLRGYWKEDPAAVDAVFAKVIAKQPGFAKASVFDTYEQGIKAGLTPKYNTLPQILEARTAESKRAIANRGFYDWLRDTGSIKKTATIPDTMDPDKLKSIFVNPENPTSKQLIRYISNYMLDDASIAKTWAQLASLSKNVYLGGGIPWTKYNMHLWNTAKVDAGLRGFLSATDEVFSDPTGKKAIEILDKKENRNFLARLMEKGYQYRPMEDIGAAVNPFAESKNIIAKGVGKAIGAEQQVFEKPLFERALPALKFKGAKYAYDSLIKSGVPEEQALSQAAEIANKFYGGLDKSIRNKTNQNLFQIVALAPDWLEANVRRAVSEWKSVAKVISGKATPQEKIYAKSFGRGAAMTAATTGAKILAGKGAWDIATGRPSDITMMPAGTIESGGRTKDRMLDVLGTSYEGIRIPTQVASKMAQGNPAALLDMLVTNRRSQPFRSAMNIIGNTDDFGNPIRGKDKYGRPISFGAASGNLIDQATRPMQLQAVQGLLDYYRGRNTPEEAVSQALELPIRYPSEPRRGPHSMTAPRLRIRR